MSKVQLNAYTLIVVLGLAIAGANAVKPEGEGRIVTEFDSIPIDVKDWSGVDLRFSEDTYRLLPSCSLLLRSYDSYEESAAVELAIVYGTNLGDFHQPEQCLEGQGLRSVSKRQVRLRGANGKLFAANSVIMEGEYGRRAFVYWFASKKSTATFLGNYKVKVFRDRLMSREIEPAALVRLSTPAEDGDDIAVKRLIGFGEMMIPYLDKEFAKGAAAVQH